jgi:ATP-dependent Clp protease ATP-binding subunit ClpA
VVERFTERARRAVVLAQDEARALDHDFVGTEHLLLGLLEVKEGLAAVVLNGLDVTAEEVRGQVVRVVGRGKRSPQGEIAFSREANKALELALRESLSIGHNYIGTEHILLGLVRDEQSVAARILLTFDVDAETIRRDVVRTLSAPRLRSLRDEKLQALEAGDLARVEEIENEEHRLVSAPRGDDEPSQIAVDVGRQPTPPAKAPLLLGWALSAVAFGLGLFAGWLIWG